MSKVKKEIKDAQAGGEKVKIFSLRLGDVQVDAETVIKYQQITEVPADKVDALLKCFPAMRRV